MGTEARRQVYQTISFLDLATASVERLDVTFNLPRETEFPPKEWGLSPDGRQLYVFSPLSGELTVVDLAGRRVLHTVALGVPTAQPPGGSLVDGPLASLRGLLGSVALAKVPFSERLQVSPDGRWLYATGARIERRSAHADGVWAIDTEQWRIAYRWLEGTEAWMVLLSSDGRHLYIQEMGNRNGAPSSLVRMVETSTGVEVGTTTELPGYSQVYTVANLYSDRYGRSRPRRVRRPDSAVGAWSLASEGHLRRPGQHKLPRRRAQRRGSPGRDQLVSRRQSPADRRRGGRTPCAAVAPG